MEMKLTEALEVASRLKAHYRAFEKIEQSIQVVVNLETETARLKKEQADLVQKLATLHQRVDEKHIELQETIDSMTSAARAESDKSQQALGKIKRHCEEQMTTVREKYIRDKDRMAREIGDLEGQRAQLVKAIQKLHAQENEVKDQAAGREVVMSTSANGQVLKNQEALDKFEKARKEERDKEIAEYRDDKKKLSDEISNLQGQKSQLDRAVEKLREQQIQLKDRATGASA